MHASIAFVAVFALCASANDPAGSWLSYAAWTAPDNGVITSLNTTWTVPSLPATSLGSNAPGWWFGVQTKDGNGALIQPILAYGYTGSHFSIFNGCFDWTDGSWTTSDDQTVQPGDKITSSVVYNKDDNSYTMYIASEQTQWSISTKYAIKKEQKEPESTAYFVLEHQPLTCRAYPTDGAMNFTNIYLEVDGKQVTPEWEAKQERPACDSKATIVDPTTIQFTWNPATEADGATPVKWGHGRA